MKRNRILLPAICVVGAVLFVGRHARAADHLDGPAVTADPAADITDLFAWMSSDASKVNLVMDVQPLADTNSKFSDAVQYVFHTTSQGAFGAAAAQSTNLICTFAASQTIQCWLGNQEYVTGDASNPAGISSADGKLKVFAGLRQDPFFFNLDGFHAATAAVQAAAANLTFDAAGCPQLDATTSSALVGLLSTNPDDGGAAQDFFAGKNVLAISVQVDKSLLTGGGSFVSVWASTNAQ